MKTTSLALIVAALTLFSGCATHSTIPSIDTGILAGAPRLPVYFDANACASAMFVPDAWRSVFAGQQGCGARAYILETKIDDRIENLGFTGREYFSATVVLEVAGKITILHGNADAFEVVPNDYTARKLIDQTIAQIARQAEACLKSGRG